MGDIFSPAKDLVAIQDILMADNELLELMGLSKSNISTKLEKIITESRWRDLVAPEVRLCMYFIPSRQTRNGLFIEDVVQIECHVPATQGILAYRVMERVFKLLHKKDINCRRLYFYNQLGELPTADGFFCCGSRFNCYTKI